MDPLISVIIIIVIGLSVWRLIRRNSSRWKVPEEPFPGDWRIILNQEISFYNSLSREEKKRFEYKVCISQSCNDVGKSKMKRKTITPAHRKATCKKGMQHRDEELMGRDK